MSFPEVLADVQLQTHRRRRQHRRAGRRSRARHPCRSCRAASAFAPSRAKPTATRPRSCASSAPRSSRRISTTRPRSPRRSKARTARTASPTTGNTSRPPKELSQARNMAQAAKAAKLQHVVWSTLEDTRKRVPLTDSAHADAHGAIQGAALRREGRCGRVVCASRRADDVPAHGFLLGKLHLLRHGSEEGAGRQVRHHAADGQRAAVRHRGRRHRQMRLRHLPAKASSG